MGAGAEIVTKTGAKIKDASLVLGYTETQVVSQLAGWLSDCGLPLRFREVHVAVPEGCRHEQTCAINPRGISGNSDPGSFTHSENPPA